MKNIFSSQPFWGTTSAIIIIIVVLWILFQQYRKNSFIEEYVNPVIVKFKKSSKSMIVSPLMSNKGPIKEIDDLDNDKLSVKLLVSSFDHPLTTNKRGR